MLCFNERNYQGAIIKNDDSEMIVTIFAAETLQEMCTVLTNVKSVQETVLNGEPVVYNVTSAVSISESAKNTYTIRFTKKLSEIDEISNTVDALLVMLLEKKNV